MNVTLAEEVGASMVDGYLPCPVAFKIAKKLGVDPREVGDIANELKIRIINCQLDCFKLEKTAHTDINTIQINEALAGEVLSAATNGRLPCAVAFEVAERLRVSRKQVADATNKLKIKIVNCQLGCFS